jgi:hypothetical protein
MTIDAKGNNGCLDLSLEVDVPIFGPEGGKAAATPIRKRTEPLATRIGAMAPTAA